MLIPITCPSCGGTVQVRAAGFSVTLVCEYCGSVLDVANPDVALIEKHSQAAAQLAARHAQRQGHAMPSPTT